MEVSIFFLLSLSCMQLALADWNKLLWVDEYGISRIVNLADESAPVCELPTFPQVDVWPPTAMTYMESSKSVLACGGMNEVDFEFRNTKDCYTYSGTGEWTPAAPLPQYHCPYTHKTRNMKIPGLGWWISGQPGVEGRGCDDESLADDLLMEDGSWTSLSLESPYAQFNPAVGMCIVQLNSTHTMFTGGWADLLYRNETYIFNWETSEWTETASMSRPRGYHGCALTKDGDVLVVAGYREGFDVVSTSEIYSVAENRWRYYAGVPKITAEFFKIIPWQDTFVMLEWNTENIWIMEDDGNWSLMDVKMGGVFNSDTDPVVMIPDDFAVAVC